MTESERKCKNLVLNIDKILNFNPYKFRSKIFLKIIKKSILCLQQKIKAYHIAIKRENIVQPHFFYPW
jgi:hypothetical protein